MYGLLLAIIYIAFISLGLPDPLLGAAWPIMYTEMNASLSWAGILSMIIMAGTIVSSLMSDRLTARLGAGKVTAISVAMTAVALFGFASSRSFFMLCLWAVPYGLGAGAVDAALNNYVALHYSSRHMNWLHCFWGVGTAISPFIMSFCLTHGFAWNSGYLFVGVFQAVLTLGMFVSLPLWKKRNEEEREKATAKDHALREMVKIPGVKLLMLAFFGYCAAETAAGLWASSYLAEYRAVDAETAARFASLFYLGITGGRFLSGLVSEKLGDNALVRLGLFGMLVGSLCIALPLKTPTLVLFGLVLLGLGCAPVYPAFIHAIPDNFGREHSQAIVGIQMASAYLGACIMPPLCGIVLERVSMSLYPVILFIVTGLIWISFEVLRRIVTNKR